MPDVGDDGDGGPLQGEAEGGRVRGDLDVQGACALALRWCMLVEVGVGRGEGVYLCAPETEHDGAAGAVLDLLGKEARVRVVLEATCQVLAANALWGGQGRTIMRPLMPTTKSNQGSTASSGFWFRRTWKPKAPWLSLVVEGASPSSREMMRLRALNMSSCAVSWVISVGSGESPETASMC